MLKWIYRFWANCMEGNRESNLGFRNGNPMFSQL